MSVESVLKLIADEQVEYVDIRFTDPKGKLQHVTVVSDLVDEDFLEEGFMFDGSSIAGWKSIDQSDMKLMPDTTSVYLDPFYAEKTLAIHCDVVEPDTGEVYDRCPRQTAKKAEAYLKSSGIGDTFYAGPEAEFFLFDDVRYSVTPAKVGYSIDADAAASGDLLAAYVSLRAEILSRLDDAGDHEFWNAGIHEEWGRVTLAEQVSYFANHEPTHLGQLADAAA